MLNGGGLCTHEEDCTARAKTQLGTSTVWAPTMDLGKVTDFLSGDSRNPFRDWNMALVPYFSGDMHAGQRTAASNETFGLYFAGFTNLMATVTCAPPPAAQGLHDCDAQPQARTSPISQVV